MVKFFRVALDEEKGRFIQEVVAYSLVRSSLWE